MTLWRQVQWLSMGPPWRTLRGRVALLLGVALAPNGFHALYSGELAPVLFWLLAVAVSWGAVHVFIARPLLSLEIMAKSYASGEATEFIAAPSQDAPAEIASLQKSFLAMVDTIRVREEAVAEALIEQRALLREVNHRVMNNLQVVLSVLSIQARDADSEDQKVALARAHRRVQLLALTQSQIYAAGEVNVVRLDQIVAEIARAVVDTRGAHMAAESLSLSLETVRMTTDRASSVAFLIAEILSLLLSRLPGDQTATISLSLRNTGEDEIEFSISAPGSNGVLDGLKTDGRLISDMARDVGATIIPDAGEQMSVRVRVFELERAAE